MCNKKSIFIISLASFLFLSESIIKYVLLHKIPEGGFSFFAGWLQIAYFTNTNLAFGIPMPPTLIVIQVIIIMFLLAIFWRHYFQKKDYAALLAISLMIAGASSNLLDRLIFGYVIDYINFFIWPVFNLADAFIVIGLLIYLFSDFSFTKRKKISPSNLVK